MGRSRGWPGVSEQQPAPGKPPLHVVTFGEAMIRLSPPRDSTLEEAGRFSVETAGSEANVAVALARLGVPATWISRLPRNALGRRIVGRLRVHGVDTSRIIWADHGRVGLYFVDIGVPPRPQHVIYDRAASAFAEVRPDEVRSIDLSDADLLHITGITPALSPGARAAQLTLIQIARARSIPISYDLNYRAKLCSPEEARAFSDEILLAASLVFLTSADAATVFGIEGTPQDQLRALAEHWPHPTIVLSAGEDGAWAWDGRIHHQPAIPGVEIDRIGRGDALTAGFIAGAHERDTDYGLACGTALAALAQTYSGDVIWSTREDLLAVLKGHRPAHFR